MAGPTCGTMLSASHASRSSMAPPDRTIHRLSVRPRIILWENRESRGQQKAITVDRRPTTNERGCEQSGVSSLPKGNLAVRAQRSARDFGRFFSVIGQRSSVIELTANG